MVSQICNKNLCISWNCYLLNQLDANFIKHLNGTLLTARKNGKNTKNNAFTLPLNALLSFLNEWII